MKRESSGETAVVSPDEITTPDSRRGTLPFKKRKMLEESQSPGSPHDERFMALRDDEKCAALALLATAATPLYDSSQSSQQEDSDQERPVEVQNSSPMTLVGPPSLSAGHENRSRPCLTEQQQQQHNRSRVHHPPLDAPLPGGCHGRTSRNNSYCRRQPCYNGSKYCKLHYQQYIVAGTRLPAGVVPAPSGAPHVCSTHQDKRFTGCDGEIRCLATTTRGRACAYVSVNATKYCHLHADYDTNPPPRRGGGSTSGSRSRQMLAKAIMLNLGDCPAVPVLTEGAFPVSGSEEGEAVTSSRLEATKNKLYSMARLANGRPLLSSISSDQWYHKRVVIGTGPLINRKGLVEKWGNGWVTVRVGNGVLHNRRSIELFLLPDKDEDSDLSSSDDKSITRYVSEDQSSSTTSPASSEQPIVNSDDSTNSIPYLHPSQAPSLSSSTISIPTSAVPSMMTKETTLPPPPPSQAPSLSSSTIFIPTSAVPPMMTNETTLPLPSQPPNQQVSSHLDLLSEVASNSTNRLIQPPPPLLCHQTNGSIVLR